MSPTRKVSAQRLIAAPAAAIFDLLADPRQHGRFDGSGMVQAPRSAPARLFLGAKFTMTMRLGLAYATTNIVSAFEENRCIAWHHVARFVWRYDLDERPEGTMVTESFDYSVPWGVAMIPLGVPERNRHAMENTLERLDALVTTPSAS